MNMYQVEDKTEPAQTSLYYAVCTGTSLTSSLGTLKASNTKQWTHGHEKRYRAVKVHCIYFITSNGFII